MYFKIDFKLKVIVFPISQPPLRDPQSVITHFSVFNTTGELDL